ncbi:GNAT family N-acetyltransferase [Puniceicoccaceae bacterium K14]|nr:GNAT family N-acetyltransferase [Puniceicoccaceae bacterium K14]
MNVYIRKPEEGDCEEFIAKTKRSHAMHRPWVFPVSSEIGYRKFLEFSQKERFRAFLVCRVSDGVMVGLVSLNEITEGCMLSAMIGYWGVSGCEGMGYLTEGVSLVLDYAFNILSLHRIEACVQPPNTKSIALVKRLGMEFEGVSRKYLCIGGEWKDHERWSMLAEDWRAGGGSLKFAAI